MWSVMVGEVSDVELVTVIQRITPITSTPTDVLMIIAAYARPWCGDAFRFGGWTRDSGQLSSSIRFDMNKNEWIALTDMKTLHTKATATIHFPTSQIFVCGGYDLEHGGVAAVSILQRYSIVSDKWMTDSMPCMHTTRYGHTSIEWSDSIYVIGGYNNFGHLSSCEVFNITSNTWSDLPNMSTARYAHSSVVDASTGTAYVYAIGGDTEKSAERYNFILRKWSRIADLSKCRYEHKSVLLPTRLATEADDVNDICAVTAVTAVILVIGGIDDEIGITSSVEQYSVNDNKWTIASWHLPEPRDAFSLHVLNNDNYDNCYDNTRLLICGGSHNPCIMSSCLIVSLKYSNVSSEWQCKGIDSSCNLPIPCRSAA